MRSWKVQNGIGKNKVEKFEPKLKSDCKCWKVFN